MSPCLLLVQTKRPSTLTALTRVHFPTNKKTRSRTKPVLNLTPVKDEEAHVFSNSVSGRCGLSFFSPLLVREDQQARVVNFDSGFFPTNSTMATIPNGVKRRCDERRSQNEQKN